MSCHHPLSPTIYPPQSRHINPFQTIVRSQHTSAQNPQMVLQLTQSKSQSSHNSQCALHCPSHPCSSKALFSPYWPQTLANCFSLNMCLGCLHSWAFTLSVLFTQNPLLPDTGVVNCLTFFKILLKYHLSMRMTFRTLNSALLTAKPSFPCFIIFDRICHLLTYNKIYVFAPFVVLSYASLH